jgi:hypothetical protein
MNMDRIIPYLEIIEKMLFISLFMIYGTTTTILLILFVKIHRSMSSDFINTMFLLAVLLAVWFIIALINFIFKKQT